MLTTRSRKNYKLLFDNLVDNMIPKKENVINAYFEKNVMGVKK